MGRPSREVGTFGPCTDVPFFLNVTRTDRFTCFASVLPLAATHNGWVKRAALRHRIAFGLVGSIAVTALAAGTLTSCGGSGNSLGAIQGVQRQPLLEVGAVTLPEVTEDDEGTPFAFKAAPGDLLVVYFGFTNCPDLCPTTLADLRAARRRIGTEASVVDLAFATVDPERDTNDILRRYAASFAERYHVLRTTDAAALQSAQEAFLASSSVTKTASGEVSVTHTATAYVVDSKGTVLVEWPFGIGAKGMEHDLRILIKQLKENTPS